MKIAVSIDLEPNEPWVDALAAALPGAEIEIWQPGAMRGDQRADYGVVWRPSQQFIDEQPQMKVLFNVGAGIDAILRMKLPPTMTIVRLEDAGMGAQMAEFVVHAVVRHFRELDAYDRGQATRSWAHRRPNERSDFPVGVLGLGVLGARVAQTLAQFEFPVMGWSRTPRDVAGVRCFSGTGSLDEFLAATRVLVCLLPLTPDTQGILNKDTLGRLKPGGYLVNVARGAHLVEEDLLALVDSGHMAGAALDVFRIEPLPEDHPFWDHPKITVTPHSSARTLMSDSIVQIAGKLAAIGRGEAVSGTVDRTRGY